MIEMPNCYLKLNGLCLWHAINLHASKSYFVSTMAGRKPRAKQNGGKRVKMPPFLTYRNRKALPAPLFLSQHSWVNPFYGLDVNNWCAYSILLNSAL